MKQKVYIETSIVSYLTARPSNDLRAMANQNTTIEWWENRMPGFDIYISEFVLYVGRSNCKRNQGIEKKICLQI
jgi:hypothetical protein